MATITFTGRIVADAKTSSNGWVNFTVVEEKRFKGENDKDNFFNCSAKQLSEAQVAHMTKGAKVEVVGNFDFDTYEKDNTKHYSHSVYVYNVVFVSGTKKKEEESAK